MSTYVLPQQVSSPRDRLSDVRVVCDTGIDGYSVAQIRWDGNDAVGIRWNGGGTNSPFPKGNPIARGKPTWFVMPAPFDQYVLMTARLLSVMHPPKDFDENDTISEASASAVATQ